MTFPCWFQQCVQGIKSKNNDIPRTKRISEVLLKCIHDVWSLAQIQWMSVYINLSLTCLWYWSSLNASCGQATYWLTPTCWSNAAAFQLLTGHFIDLAIMWVLSAIMTALTVETLHASFSWTCRLHLMPLTTSFCVMQMLFALTGPVLHWVTLTFDLAFRWAFCWAKP